MKTYFLAEHPTVVVICDSPEKRWLLQQHMQSNDVVFSFQTSTEFLAEPPSSDQFLYKYLWIVDHEPQNMEELLVFFESQSTAVMAICCISTPVADQEQILFQQYQQTSLYQQHIVQYLHSRLPDIQLIACRDVVEEMKPLARDIMQKIHKNTVLDPQLKVQPLTFAQISQQLISLLFRPAKGKIILLQGQVLTTKQLLSSALLQWQQFYGESWIVKHVEVEQVPEYIFTVDQTVTDGQKAEKAFTALLVATAQDNWKPPLALPEPQVSPTIQPTDTTHAAVHTHVHVEVDSYQVNQVQGADSEVLPDLMNKYEQPASDEQQLTTQTSYLDTTATSDVVKHVADQSSSPEVADQSAADEKNSYSSESILNVLNYNIKRKIAFKQTEDAADKAHLVARLVSTPSENVLDPDLVAAISNTQSTQTGSDSATRTTLHIDQVESPTTIDRYELESTVTTVANAPEQNDVTVQTVTNETHQHIESSTTPITSDKELSSEIQRIFDQPRMQVKIQTVSKKAKDQKVINKKSRRKQLVFMAGLIFVGMGMGILTLIGVFFWSSSQLKASLLSLAAQYEEGQKIETFLHKIDLKAVKQQHYLTQLQLHSYQTLFSSTYLEDTQSVVELAAELMKLQQNLVTLEELEKKTVRQLFGQETGDVTALSDAISLHAQSILEQTAQIEDRMKYLSSDSTDEATQKKLTALSEELIQMRASVSELKAVTPLLPELTGVNGRRVYAVLLQNNQELRPTGGFIQAIALLSFENGTLINQQVFSAYDEKLNIPGQVTPPAKITELLHEQQWYIRDANWDPHFPATTSDIKMFIEKSLGTNIDGVIGLNGYAVEEILERTGPLDLPEYEEVITNRNLFERLEFHSDAVLADKGKFQDYSKVFLSALLKKTSALSEDKISGFITAIGTGLKQQQVQISLLDPEEQQIIQTYGWTGALLQPACPTPLQNKTCVMDTYMQVEANVGINKANTYVERHNEHVISLEQNFAVHHRKVTFSNTAKTNSWPKGAYNAYLRFYLTPQSQLDSITIDGVIITPDKITEEVYLGRKVVGVQISVPIQTTQVLTLNYRTKIPQHSQMSYVFFDQKQSGLASTPLRLIVGQSDNKSPSLISPQGEMTQDGVLFEVTQDSHLLFGLQYD